MSQSIPDCWYYYCMGSWRRTGTLFKKVGCCPAWPVLRPSQQLQLQGPRKSENGALSQVFATIGTDRGWRGGTATPPPPTTTKGKSRRQQQQHHSCSCTKAFKGAVSAILQEYATKKERTNNSHWQQDPLDHINRQIHRLDLHDDAVQSFQLSLSKPGPSEPPWCDCDPICFDHYVFERPRKNHPKRRRQQR